MTTWNDTVYGPTRDQLAFVETLRQRLHISGDELDRLCIDRFDTDLSGCKKHQVSSLIDEMLRWKRAPADLQRERGQLSLMEGLG